MLRRFLLWNGREFVYYFFVFLNPPTVEKYFFSDVNYVAISGFLDFFSKGAIWGDFCVLNRRRLNYGIRLTAVTARQLFTSILHRGCHSRCQTKKMNWTRINPTSSPRRFKTGPTTRRSLLWSNLYVNNIYKFQK